MDKVLVVTDFELGMNLILDFKGQNPSRYWILPKTFVNYYAIKEELSE
jgi:hypothetical protein